MIGRFSAACEISMSDLGATCCDAGVAALTAGACITISLRCLPIKQSGQSRSGREADAGCEFAGADLAAVGGLHAQGLDAAIGAHDRKTLAVDFDDLAHLAA